MRLDQRAFTTGLVATLAASRTRAAGNVDEPTASLDFGNQGRVLKEIRALAASGHGVLFTTHDPNHALRAADRACLLRRGAIVGEGLARDVLTSDNLSALYGAKVRRLIDVDGEQAFLPE